MFLIPHKIWFQENPNAGRQVDEDDNDIEYDEDGNPIVPMKDKHIDPLEALDHTQIEYQAFEKSFYTEHPDIVGLSPIQIIDLQQKLGIRYVIKTHGPSEEKLIGPCQSSGKVIAH